MFRSSLLLGLLLSTVTFIGCSHAAGLPFEAGVGPHPTLPEAKSELIPTMNIAPAIGWVQGATPVAAKGLQVKAFAKDLKHPRWLYTLPNGDVLVAETNAPPKPDDKNGIKGFISQQVMKKAGAVTSSANRITLLRDTDHDGVADERHVFIKDLNSPYGMALVGQDFYVAESDGIRHFVYQDGQTEITAKGERLVDLPGGTINHHWTKNVIASKDGKKLYAAVGSNSNVMENGAAAEEGRAAIWEIDRATGAHRIFASGLRNPSGLAWQPQSGALWTDVNERDELQDLVPDYMTSVKDGGFYGWPYSYYGQHLDPRIDEKDQRPDLVAKAIVPDYALGNHTASLGLTFYEGKLLPQHYLNGAFIGQHGSWNRKPRSGYKVIFVPFANGQPAGQPEDILTGFLDTQGNAQGRPVGVIADKVGALLVADDVGNTVWRVTPVPANR